MAVEAGCWYMANEADSWSMAVNDARFLAVEAGSWPMAFEADSQAIAVVAGSWSMAV